MIMASLSPRGGRLPTSRGAPAMPYRRPRARWATTLALAVALASVACASPIEELPQPTAVAHLELAPLDGVPQPQPPAPTPDPIPASEDVEELLIDTRIRVKDAGGWTALHPAEHELRKRTTTDAVTSTFEITISTETSTTLTTSAASTKTSGSSTSASTTTATTSSSPLPSFFDGALSNNYSTSTCPKFINSMLKDSQFQACYPISLLLQGSNSFFEAEESLVSISRVLDHACDADVNSCGTYLADMATNLTKSENCGDDYDAGNPTVTEAYLGLVAYQVVYSATCLKNNETSAYCFGEAVTNSTDASETYFYYLPLNSTLPGSTNPVCGGCLQDTMDIYHVATANRKQPIASTYADAAQDVDVICGPTFANTTLAEAITTSGTSSLLNQTPPPWLLVTTFWLMTMSWLI